MKKILAQLLIVFTVILSLACNNALALIRSENDINTAIIKLQQIQQTDFLKFINKSELIGNRLSQFNMVSEQYKTTALTSADRLKSIKSQAETFSKSSDISQTDINNQITTLYNDANSVLFDMDSKTITYLYSLNSMMPSITYQRYIKRFSTFYNGLGLSGQHISVK